MLSAIRSPSNIIPQLQVKIRVNFRLWKQAQDTFYLREAIEGANLGFQILDYYRRTLNDVSSRLEYVEYEYELYDDSFEPYFEAYQQKLISINELWKVSEKARSIHISEQSNLRSIEKSYRGVDSILVAEESDLLDSIYKLSNHLLQTQDNTLR